jgi:hypothetical protein
MFPGPVLPVVFLLRRVLQPLVALVLRRPRTFRTFSCAPRSRVRCTPWSGSNAVSLLVRSIFRIGRLVADHVPAGIEGNAM